MLQLCVCRLVICVRDISSPIELNNGYLTAILTFAQNEFLTKLLVSIIIHTFIIDICIYNFITGYHIMSISVRVFKNKINNRMLIRQSSSTCLSWSFCNDFIICYQVSYKKHLFFNFFVKMTYVLRFLIF